jgi:hypothetical protein
MSTLHQQIRELEADAKLIFSIRAEAKTEGGRLTSFGKKFVHVCSTHGIANSTISKILDITPAAVSQNIAKSTKDND